MRTFRLVEEIGSPEYQDHETGEILVESNPYIRQVIGLDVVEYDENTKEIVEWLERFSPNEEDKAKKALEYYKNL